MKTRRLRYTWSGARPWPRRGSRIICFNQRTRQPTGTQYTVLRVVSASVTPTGLVMSLIVARCLDPSKPATRGAYDLWWDPPRRSRKPR